jgi:hypothetical protein
MRTGGDLDGAERVLRWALDFNPTHGGLNAELGALAGDRGDAIAAIGWMGSP